MTLLLTVIAAISATVVWYTTAAKTPMQVGMLCWMYWGAALMWLADAIFEYIGEPEAYFNPEPIDMLNDAYLGLSVIVLGGVIWIATVLIRDPLGTVAAVLRRAEAQPDLEASDLEAQHLEAQRETQSA